MKALMITAPNQAEVWEVPNPVAVPGEVIVDVKRAGICGTDIEFFTGEMCLNDNIISLIIDYDFIRKNIKLSLLIYKKLNKNYLYMYAIV